LLADYAAGASCLVAGGDMCKRICQVIELATVEKLLGHVVLQPEYLWYFHFDRHLAPYITKQIVVGGIDLVCLFHRPVIQP
jgi:hypothetical protein